MFSTGCASRWEQGKEGATGHYGAEGWRLLACLHHLSALGAALGRRGCSLTVPKGWLDLHFPGYGALLWVCWVVPPEGAESWAGVAAQGGLIPAARPGVLSALRLALACQEGKGAI